MRIMLNSRATYFGTYALSHCYTLWLIPLFLLMPYPSVTPYALSLHFSLYLIPMLLLMPYPSVTHYYTLLPSVAPYANTSCLIPSWLSRPILYSISIHYSTMKISNTFKPPTDFEVKPLISSLLKPDSNNPYRFQQHSAQSVGNLKLLKL
jgi:hypothetical protein